MPAGVSAQLKWGLAQELPRIPGSVDPVPLAWAGTERAGGQRTELT